MVAPDKLMSARIVEDQVEMKGQRRISNGTKVREDVLSNDPDTLFPLQGALGYEITQTLFIGKHTLLVEGASDILYLQALSDALRSRKRVGLDPRWTMCPTGGIGNVRAFVSLFGGNKLDITVLADQTKKDAKKLEELRKSAILRAGRVFTISDFTGKEESDIEDLFEAEVFVSIVNDAYELPGSHRLSAMRKLPVVLICRGASGLRHTSDTSHIDAVPPRKRGASRSSRTLGAGCGGRGSVRRAKASLDE
jgi:hypothetical protein